jgi:hypothetical protein
MCLYLITFAIFYSIKFEELITHACCPLVAETGRNWQKLAETDRNWQKLAETGRN